MQTLPRYSHLSDSELRAKLIDSAGLEREAVAHVIALLAEYDMRRLYLAEGYKSLFVFCTGALHVSEDAAYTRIQVARAARKCPEVLDALITGSVSLSAIALLAPHLTTANVVALLAEARHKRKDDVRVIVARLNPRPVNKLPEKTAEQRTLLRPGMGQ